MKVEASATVAAARLKKSRKNVSVWINHTYIDAPSAAAERNKKWYISTHRRKKGVKFRAFFYVSFGLGFGCATCCTMYINSMLIFHSFVWIISLLHLMEKGVLLGTQQNIKHVFCIRFRLHGIYNDAATTIASVIVDPPIHPSIHPSNRPFVYM